MTTQTKDVLKDRYIYRGDPLGDPVPDELAVIIDRHRGHPDAMITVLEEIQDHYGFLPQRELQYTARELGFPLSRIYGVATFYNLFHLTPPGRYVIRICKGTACHVNRSDEILGRIEGQLGIEESETTSDKLFTLQTIACMGACSLAPVMVINDHTYGRMTPDKAASLVGDLQADAAGGVKP